MLERAERCGDHHAGDREGAVGGIVLFYNAALHTPEALPELIEYLQCNGYNFVPVSEILLGGEYDLIIAFLASLLDV